LLFLLIFLLYNIFLPLSLLTKTSKKSYSLH
jgi:regulatory protein YycI of two-component signal transduction system YycFG